jgi:hypothetical protein
MKGVPLRQSPWALDNTIILSHQFEVFPYSKNRQKPIQWETRSTGMMKLALFPHPRDPISRRFMVVYRDRYLTHCRALVLIYADAPIVDDFV